VIWAGGNGAPVPVRAVIRAAVTTWVTSRPALTSPPPEASRMRSDRPSPRLDRYGRQLVRRAAWCCQHSPFL
jgi:hypothetical protein